MKVRPSVKPICEKCKVIRRKGKVMVIDRVILWNKRCDKVDSKQL